MATISTTRKTLIARVRKGDPAAWADFCDGYKNFIWGITKAYGLNDMDAQDVSQNVLTGLWGKNEQGKTKFSFDPVGPAKFRTWFSKVIKNKLIDHFRKRNPSAPQALPQAEEHDEESPHPDAAQLCSLDKERFEREFEKHRKQDVLRKALPLLEGRVEPRTYQAFYLCKSEDQRTASST